MNSATHPKTITLSHLKSKSLVYPSLVPSSLQSLDTFRYETIPASLRAQRENQTNTTTKPTKPTKSTKAKPPTNPPKPPPSRPPHLTLPALKTLTEWKLKHGTFRPRLLALVSSNPAEEIESVTARAFEIYSLPSEEPPKKSNDDNDNGIDTNLTTRLITALNHLTTLKGVGPATASLILSCFDPANVPFFSDELFRWLHLDEKGGGGWQRKMAYSVKEYRGLVERWGELRQRLGGEVEAWELEKGAWVMGREEGGGKAGVGKGEDGKKRKSEVRIGEEREKGKKRRKEG